MYFEIKRLETASESVRGVLLCEGILTGIFTLEPPERGNERDISCINGGLCWCKRHISPSKGEVFWLQDVYNRSFVYIGHTGTTVKDTLGCILLGLSIGDYRGKKAVFQSKKACERLFCITSGLDGFWLKVS